MTAKNFKFLGVYNRLNDLMLEIPARPLQPLYVHLGIYKEALRPSLHGKPRLYHIHYLTDLDVEEIIVCPIVVT